MNSLVPFSFNGDSVRVVMVDGEPWFVARDVATVLGYADPTNAIKAHCRGVAKHHPITDALNRTQEARIIPERDVYRLVMRSKLPAAERFEEWVVGEVLPSIRKDGSYGANPMAVLNDPAAMRGLLLSYTEKVLHLEAEKAAMADKVERFDRIAEADGTMCVTNAAKTLQMRPKDLFSWLSQNRWIYRRQGGAGWLAYQDRLQTGHLMHKITTVSRSDGTEKVVEQVLVTAKGLTKLAELIALKPRAVA
jgi:prophage antirepressor-like protein